MPTFDPADREPAKTDAQARTRFLRPLNGSLSCVAPSSHWLTKPTGDTFSAFVVPDEIVALPTESGECIYLRSTLTFVYIDDERFPGERKVSTKLYAHTTSEQESLKPGLYSWEWNDAEPQYPHVHVLRGDTNHPGLGKFHVPTGRVFFEHVVLFLIRDYGVIPQREDWFDVLSESFRRVSGFSSWGGGSGGLTA